MSSPCYTAKVMIKIKTANKNAKKLSKNNKMVHCTKFSAPKKAALKGLPMCRFNEQQLFALHSEAVVIVDNCLWQQITIYCAA